MHVPRSRASRPAEPTLQRPGWGDVALRTEGAVPSSSASSRHQPQPLMTDQPVSSRVVDPLSASVVICTRNRPEELRRCLLSLALTLPTSVGVAVVDSSDPECLAQNGNTVGELRRPVDHWTSEPGLTVQRNSGAEMSSADVLIYIDDDVVSVHDFVTPLLAEWSIDIVGRAGSIVEPLTQRGRLLDRLLMFDSLRGGRVLSSGRAVPIRWPSAASVSPVKEISFASGCFMAFLRSAVLDVRFDEERSGYGLGEDADFCIRVAATGRLEWVRDSVLVHCETGGGVELSADWFKSEIQERLLRSVIPSSGVRPFAFGLASLRHAPQVCMDVWRRKDLTQAISFGTTVLDAMRLIRGIEKHPSGHAVGLRHTRPVGRRAALRAAEDLRRISVLPTSVTTESRTSLDFQQLHNVGSDSVVVFERRGRSFLRRRWLVQARVNL